MPRHVNLRQIEAFKAVMIHGTVSRGAAALNISQPAMSKLIAHLELDTDLKLFDRHKGRLAPTEHAMRLHEEVERIFAGVRQIESAVSAIRREEQGRLTIGVMPAIAGAFIRRVTTGFLETHPGIFFSVQGLASQWTVDRLVTRQLDIGLVNATIDNPYVLLEPLIEHPLVCIMPNGHPLSEKARIKPNDLDHVPFVSFNSDSAVHARVNETFQRYRVSASTVLVAGGAPTLCEFVAAGIGVSLVHPLMASGFEDRVAVRPFEPSVPFAIQIARNAESRNARLVDAFAQELREHATNISEAMLRRE